MQEPLGHVQQHPESPSPARRLPSVSPLCLKLDARLCLTGIEQESITVATPFAGPKGKAPWIEIDGEKLGGSTFVVAYLTKRFGVDPDAGLTPEQRGMAVAIQRMIDENLYWTMVHDHWMHKANWRVFRDVVLGGPSAPLRRVLGPVARRGVRKQLEGHGMGKHSAEEVAMIGPRDVAAPAGILVPKPWFSAANPPRPLQ